MPTKKSPFDLVRGLPEQHLDLVFSCLAKKIQDILEQKTKVEFGPLSKLPSNLPEGWDVILTARDPRAAIARHWKQGGTAAAKLGLELSKSVTHVGLATTAKESYLVYICIGLDFSRQVFPYVLIGYPPSADDRVKGVSDLVGLLQLHAGLHGLDGYLPTVAGLAPPRAWSSRGGALVIGRSFDDDEEIKIKSKKVFVGKQASTVTGHMLNWLKTIQKHWAAFAPVSFQVKPIKSWKEYSKKDFYKTFNFEDDGLIELDPSTLIVARFPFAGRNPIFEVVSYHAVLKIDEKRYRAYRADTIERALEGLHCAASALSGLDAEEEFTGMGADPRGFYVTDVKITKAS